MRIVEFGPVAIFARTHPDVTTWIFAGENTKHLMGTEVEMLRWDRLFELRRLLRTTRRGFVACHPPDRPGQADRRASLIGAGYELILRFSPLPIVGLDFSDRVALTRTALRLLDRCCVYFKREFPVDRAELLPTGSRAERSILERNLHKIQPTSLGLGLWRLDALPNPLPEKMTDVFFSGAMHSAVRKRGAKIIAGLAHEGIRVDVSEERLDRSDYLRRLAQAHLAWSPEGLGWQCFRHFEAAAVGTVPVINYPRIEMPAPFEAERHCFFYDPSGEDLGNVIKRALADKKRLMGMSAAVRNHVFEHHTHAKVVERILNAVSDMAPVESGARILR